MRIDSYNVQMQASNSFVQKHESHVTSNFFTQTVSQNQDSPNTAVNTINFSKISTQKVVYNSEEELSSEDKIKKRIIELLLEQLVDKKSKIKLYPNDENTTKEINNTNPYERANQPNNQSTQTLWGFVYESTQEYYQKSSIDFDAKAIVKTSNGDFDINLNLSFSQEFHEVHKERIQIGTANFEDPLIINFANNENSFGNISKNLSFEFDINSDGTKENIPLLKQGVGFLALDKNKNNEIDKANELFGPQTGNGFNELKAYDEDGNNWIDENDSIFKDLRVWEKTENGDNNLLTLSQAGVGAIYLASIQTDFNYAKSIGEDNAKLKESSIFLKENGEAGLVTSVDFVV